jgi:hypothetical protein
MSKRKPPLELSKKQQDKYIREALDYYGSAIRDNTRAWKIEFGRKILLDGYDPYEDTDDE